MINIESYESSDKYTITELGALALKAEKERRAKVFYKVAWIISTIGLLLQIAKEYLPSLL